MRLWQYHWTAHFDAHGHGGHGSHGGHGAHGGDAQARQLRFYTAQVIWDETMASGASGWLAQHRGGRLLLLAGNGHCHRHAIVERVVRRGKVDALSVLLAPKEAELSQHAKRDYVVKVAAGD